jgi:hypothetical protein
MGARRRRPPRPPANESRRNPDIEKKNPFADRKKIKRTSHSQQEDASRATKVFERTCLSKERVRCGGGLGSSPAKGAGGTRNWQPPVHIGIGEGQSAAKSTNSKFPSTESKPVFFISSLTMRSGAFFSRVMVMARRSDLASDALGVGTLIEQFDANEC